MSELVSRRRLLSTGVALGLGSLAGCSGLLGSDASNDSWPMARYGPGRTAFNPSSSGPRDSLSTAWSVSTEELRSDAGVESLSPKVSDPIVADGSIFVATWARVARPDNPDYSRACYVHRVTENGEIAWSNGPLTPVINVGERVSLAVVSGTVYVVAPDADHQTGLWALDAESGEILWEHEKYALGEPIVHDGEVIVQGNVQTGTIYAASTDGTHDWTYTATTEDSDVVPANGTGAADDERTYVPMYRGIVAVDRSGERDWFADVSVTAQSGETVNPRSVVAGESIHVPVGMINMSDGKLVALDPTDGSLRWEFQGEFDAERRQTALENVPAGYNPGGLYLGVYGRPALADGTLYMFGLELTESDLGEWWNKDNTEYLVPKLHALTAEDGDVEWTAPLDGLFPVMSPTVADGTVYFAVDGEETRLLAIDAASGDVIDRTTEYPTVGTNVAVAGERLYVGGESGELLAIGPA